MQELINDLIQLIGSDFTVNGRSPSEALTNLSEGTRVKIFVPAERECNAYALHVGSEYIIQVDAPMVSKDDPNLRFHGIWNDNKPMPFRVMVCKIEKETRGMYLVSAHAEPLGSETCMKCGRVIVNPISRLYGLGPECGHHAYINPFNTEQELVAHLDEIEAKFRAIKWSGWIIKAQILACEEV